MNKNEIEGIKPFNSFHYKNCFYSAFLSVVEHFNKKVLDILSNDVLLYAKEEDDDIGVKYLEAKELTSVIRSMGIGGETKFKCEDVISDIKAALCKNRPVILWIDCYYQSARKEMYFKKHWEHAILLYGFNDDKKEFKVIEQVGDENSLYDKLAVSYEDISNCYNSYMERFYSDDISVFSEFFLDDLREKEILENDLEHSFVIFKEHFNNSIYVIEKGLEILNEFIKNYKEKANDSEIFSQKCDEWVSFVNNVINTKRVEQYKILNFFGEESELFSAYTQLIKYWENVRIVFGKYIYTFRYNEKSVEKSMKIFDLIAFQEKKCFEIMKEILCTQEEKTCIKGELAKLISNENNEFLEKQKQEEIAKSFIAELGKIESTLLSIDGIVEATVIEQENASEDRSLCAYLVTSNSLNVKELREELGKKLPQHMIPAYFIKLDKIPLNNRQKLGEEKLLEFNGGEATKTEYVAAKNEIEEKLVKLWSEVLGISKVGIDDNFFELGGDSLKAIQTVAMIHKELNVEVSIGEAFTNPTIRELGKCIETCNDRMYLPIEPAEKGDSYKVSSAQERLFILNQMDTDSLAYNMPLILLIEGELQKKKLKKIFQNLVERHEALRTSFELKNGEIVQISNERVEFEIEYTKINEENSKEVINDFVRTFDLGIAPLFRVGIIEIHSKKHILMLDMHHIISDGASMGILTKEFMQLYQEKSLPELKIQYKDYAVWQNTIENIERIKMQEKYWFDRLGEGISQLNMPLDYERKEMQTFTGKTTCRKIDRDLVQKMSLLAQRTNTTMNIILMSFYSILLSKYCKQEDIIVGITVANRNHEDLKDVIGAFINFLPIKSTVNEGMSISKFIEEEKKIMKDAYDNQEYPFDEMVKKFVKKVDKTRNPIFDTMLIYHNEIEVSTDVEIDGLKFSQINFENKTSTLDFKLDIRLNSEDGLDCYLEYNTNIYEEKSMLQLLNHFELLMSKASNDVELNISEIDIFDEEEKLILRQKQKISNDNKSNLTIAISATFTCDPIEEYLQWWCYQYGKEVEVKVAPYNQVFQELLNSESAISKNKGINLLLIRFEDWIRDIKASDEEKCDIIRNNYEKLIETIKNMNKSAVNIIGIFPVSEKLGLSNSVVDYIENLNRKWKATIQEIEDLELIDFNEGIELYSIKEIFDPIKDRAGHMPFSDEYYGAIGTMVARKVCLLDSNPFKVIAVDCDNTLWGGICGEDGALGVNIDKPYMELQKLLIEKQNEGMIIVLCSKNNEEDVWNVFENNPNMLLRKEHLAGWKINWNSKCENLKDLAKELNLGIDSFIFIDDSHIECYDMMRNNPEVLTLQLPENPMHIPKYLKHIWAFDKTKVTKEDKVRTKQYQQERQRKEIQNSTYNLTDFLKELELKIYINEIEKNEIDRVAQLTQRTNQFNLSTIRRTGKEIEEILNNPDVKCWTIKVEDRFGQYGLAGTIIMKRLKTCLFLDTLLLSCRVLGRKVEDAILLELCKYCKENGVQKIEANFYPTLKNRMVEEYLIRSGWYKINENNEFVKYELQVKENFNSMNFIECYYGRQNEKEKEEEAAEKFQCILDHIGVAVRDIKTVGEYYSTINYLKSETIYDPLKDAYLALYSKEEYDTIELMTMNNNEVLSYMSPDIESGTPYHLCYRVEDFQEVIKNLNGYGVHWELVKDFTPAVLFGGKEVLFMQIKGIGLIEFLQDPVYEYKEAFQKLNTIRISVTDKENAIKFFEMLGYCEANRIYDTVNKVLSIQLSRKGSGNIELLIGTNNKLMLSATKPHIQEICYRSNNKKNMLQLLKSKGYQYSDVLENQRYGSLSEASSIIQFKDMKYNLYYFTKDTNQELTEPEWKINIYDEKTLLHKNFILPLNYYTGKMLLKLPIYENKQNIQISRKYHAPRNEVEETLARIWSEVLGVDKVGINDSFFELGGHSLKAVLLISKIQKEFNRELKIGELYEASTIKELSEYIKLKEEVNYNGIKKVDKKSHYNVTPNQKGLFIANKNNLDIAESNVPLIINIQGNVDRDKLEKILIKLINRHEAFRTSFETFNEDVVCKIHDNFEFKLQYGEYIGQDIESVVYGFVQHFDLSSYPLMRALLLKTYEEKYTLIIDMHHIIVDGYSLNILYRELVDLYMNKALQVKEYDISDYLFNESNFVKDSKIKDVELFWKNKFANKDKPIYIPHDLNDFKKYGYKGEKIQFKISKETVEKIMEIANKEKTTIHTFIFAVYTILLRQYTGENDIVVGSISAGRRLVEYKDIIGSFINLIPIMNRVEIQDTFIEFLNKTNSTLMTSYENQYFPFHTLNVDKLIKTLVNFHTEEEKNEDLLVEGLKLEHYEDFKYNEAHLDIQADFEFLNCGGLNCIFEYNANKFKEQTIRRMTNQFSNIIHEVINDTIVKIMDIRTLSMDEEKQILNDFNNTFVDYDKNATLHRMFEKQVEKTPNSIAVEYYDEKITYRELNEKANTLARKLINLGVKEESIVGIKVDRSIEMMIGLLSILKAGGAYLPIDSEYPIERSKFMIEDSNTKIILTQEKFMKDCDIKEFNGEVIDLNNSELYMGENGNLNNHSSYKNLAYIIYTSGSTGKPKGVMVEHRNVVAYINAFCHQYKINDKDVVLQQASYGFDTSIEELYPILLVGGKLIITTKYDIKDMNKLIELIDENKITIISASPLLIYAINQMKIGKSLRLVISGGDVLKKEYISNIIKNCDVYNTYGPTESTVCATYYKCNENLEDNIPIGKPIANYSVYILNKEGKVQPIGLPGELCIGGPGVTRGYLNQDELTKEKFIENSVVNGEKLYRTGDLARWLSNGNIEYLGRLDNQIKIRGYRVELGEIEKVILKDLQIKDVTIVYNDDMNGNQCICAYIVSDINVNIKALKRKLYMQLPSYMVPQFIMQIDNMPMNVNGKLDKKMLPIPKFERLKDNEYLEPRNDVEKRLCEIVSEVIKVDSISINDNLFDLGADSLKLIIILPKIQKEFNVKVSIEDIFSNATIKEICEKIMSLDKNKYSAISKVEEREYYPASSAQKRLYMLNQLEPNSTSYNIPIILKIKGTLDIMKVQDAFACLIYRHEILRTTFKLENNNIVQRVNDKIEFLVEYDEANNLNFKYEDFQKNFIRPFNLENGPLIRVKITKFYVDEFILQIDMHHIISDGHSIEILINEFNNIYLGNELPEVKIQYRDFAVWQDRMIEEGNFKEQEEYWLDMYRNSIPKLNMPLDYEKLEIQSFEGDKVSFKIDEELLGKIRRICNETGTTMYMVLFASYATLLANYTNDEDMIIGVPVLGRGHSDLENAIGMFVNTLAIRVYPEASKTFKEFLYEAKNTLLKSYGYQEFELDRLVEALKLVRTTNGNPLFDTIFNFRTNDHSDTVLENIDIEFMESNNKISKFDFSLNVFETKEKVYFEIEYCTKLFSRKTIERLSQYYVKVLSAVSENTDIYLNEVELEDFEIKEISLDDIEFNF